MGFIRSSNFLELPSFHLRKIVQRIRIPPMEATMAIKIVTTLLPTLAAPVNSGRTVAEAWTEVTTVLVDLTLSVWVSTTCPVGAGVVSTACWVGVVEVSVVEVVDEVEEAEVVDSVLVPVDDELAD
jgi:hypothetical protein